MKKGNLKISGLVETYLTDKKGVKRKVGEAHNAIEDAEFLPQLAKYMTSPVSNNLIEFDNMFILGNGYTDSGNQTGTDGIIAEVLNMGSLQAAFLSVASQPAANQFRVTGTWTNPEATTKTLAYAELGRQWIKAKGWADIGDGGYFDYPNGGFVLASGGMANTDVPSGELITIVWTITFTVH